MIVGIGVDLVDIPRFERALARTPGLLTRLFADAERDLRGPSLAARYAAKEALIKALGGSDGVHWTEIEVARASGVAPRFALSGSTAAVVSARGITTLHLSLSHDAGLAAAYVVAESGFPVPVATTPSAQDTADAIAAAGPPTSQSRAERTDFGAISTDTGPISVLGAGWAGGRQRTGGADAEGSP